MKKVAKLQIQIWKTVKEGLVETLWNINDRKQGQSFSVEYKNVGRRILTYRRFLGDLIRGSISIR